MYEHKHDFQGGKRVAMESLDGGEWYLGYSPRNGHHASVEGPWEDWVALAKKIIEEDEKRKATK